MLSELKTKGNLKLIIVFILITIVIVFSGTGYFYTRTRVEYIEDRNHYLWPQRLTEESVNETGSSWKNVRVLCLILSSSSGQTKMAAVNATWASKCDKNYYVLSREINKTDNVEMLITPVKEGRDHLTAKVRYALTYAYEKHRHEFDWFLKCDDDTYVIMENLRHMLASIDHNKPSYMGFHMKLLVKNGYMSGGGGYVISSRALRDVVRIGFKNGACLLDGGNEDVEIGKCLQASGVQVLSTLDMSGEETFHAVSLFEHLTANPETFWLKNYAWNKHSMGRMCCSRYSVTYHYVRPDEMYIFHQLLYHTEVLGILRPPVPDKIFDLQPVNPS